MAKLNYQSMISDSRTVRNSPIHGVPAVNKSFNTLEKVTDILCLFDLKHMELSAQEIAERVAMPLSTTYRYIQVFLKKQILSKDESSNKFSLGLTIARLDSLPARKYPLWRFLIHI